MLDLFLPCSFYLYFDHDCSSNGIDRKTDRQTDRQTANKQIFRPTEKFVDHRKLKGISQLLLVEIETKSITKVTVLSNLKPTCNVSVIVWVKETLNKSN